MRDTSERTIRQQARSIYGKSNLSGRACRPYTNVIDVQISRLRGKIDKDFELPLLHTLRGAGYKLSQTP